MDEKELRKVVMDTVKETLLSLGIEPHDPLDMQKDFSYLRDLRLMSESIKSKSVLTIIGALSLGALAMIALGLKKYFLG